MYWLRTLIICTTVSLAFGCWLTLGAKERTSWRSLGALLASMWAVEFGAVILTLSDRPNGLLYNVAWPFYFVLLLIINQHLYPLTHKVLTIVLILFMVTWTLNLAVIDQERAVVTQSIILGAFLLCAIYFRSLWLMSDSYTERLSRSGAFWIALSVVVYYGSLTPLLGTINYLVSAAPETASDLYWLVQFLAALHYIALAIACLMERRPAPVPQHHGD